MYVEANPVNATDPSGNFSVDCQTDSHNSRNLTGWLTREMTAQSNDFPVRLGIYSFTRDSSALLNPATRLLAQAVLDRVELSNSDKFEIAKALTVGSAFRFVGGLWWKEMVKNKARWDFKHQIKPKPPRGLGTSIMLCDTETCNWYEYSMPGNIFYAYVGRAAGFTEFELRVGAVYAQQMDPENNPDTNNWPWWSPWGLDQATDQAAITLGFQVYNTTRGSSNPHTVLNAFKIALKQYKAGLGHELAPIEPYVAKWPIGPNGPEFPLKIFDGKNGVGPFGE
jgi:hypothetical protein